MSGHAKRKPSGTAVPKVDASGKFYNGPTVPKKTASTSLTTGNTQKVSSSGPPDSKGKSIVIKQRGREIQRRTPKLRNHTFLNSFIIALTFVSFFSLYYCPPPTTSSTVFTKLNPLSRTNVEQPLWQTIVCRPTNAYRSHILEPYIIPRVKARVETVKSHPLVVKHVKPLIQSVKIKIWRRYLRPVWRQAGLHLDTINSRFVKPRLPIIKKQIQVIQAKLERLSRPYIAKLQAEYDTLLLRARPITERFTLAQQKIESSLSHPAVKNAQKFAKQAEKYATQAYDSFLPYGQRISETVSDQVHRKIIPNTKRDLLVLIDTAELAWYQLVALVSRVYHTHLHDKIRPYLNQANEMVYMPYLSTHVRQWTPALASIIMTPSLDDVRSFIRGSVESVKSSAQDGVNKVADAADSVRTAVGSGAASATQAVKNAVSNTEEEEIEKKQLERTRKDIDQAFDTLEGRVAVEGKKQKDLLNAEIQRTIETYRKKDASTILSKAISNLQKEASRTTKAYKKYLEKLSLSPDSDKATKAEEKEKVKTAAVKAGSRLDSLRDGFCAELDQGLLVRKVVDSSRDKIAASVEKVVSGIVADQSALAQKMASFKLVTHKDWVRYQEVEKTARNWSKEYEKILDKEMKPLVVLQSETRSEVSSLIEDYHKEIKTNEKNALYRLGGGVGVLPVDAAAVKDAADAAIGKSVEQVMEALQAAGVVGGVAAAANGGVLSSASSIAAAAASSASSAVIGEPTVDSIASKVVDAAAAASASIASVLDQVSSTVHSATRMAMKAAGAEPTPDTWSEQAEDVLSQASATVASLFQGASSALHAATRTGLKAIGATPTPETWAEQAEDMLSVASASVSSVMAQASSAVHAGTRTILETLGGTPAPESIPELVADTAADLAGNVAGLRDAAGSVLHDATRSASSFVGVTPTPESFGEHAASLSARVEETVSSIISDAEAYADQATGSVKKVFKDEL